MKYYRQIYISVLTTGSIIFSFTYLWKITFIPEGVTVSEHGKLILGFLLGTLLTTAFNFYMGGNESHDTINPPINPIDPGTIYPLSLPGGNPEAILGDDSTGKSNLDDEPI